jgi:F0F1-type ATP synthase membrane subunit c/vacuolar-type H+-ATPase subunit K
MISPAMGILVALACLTFAGFQIHLIFSHYFGGDPLPAQEPYARMLFAAVFLLAAFGVTIALLEYINGEVALDDQKITVCCWLGCKREIRWDEVASVIALRPADSDPDFPFHWLAVATEDGRRLRLSGGPWSQPRSVEMLRHEIIDRLDLQPRTTESARWALIFAATRNQWS